MPSDLSLVPLLGGGVAGLLAGALSGAFGVGGGIVLVPLLGLLLGLGQHEAQGVTLAVLLLPVGLPAVLAYLRQVRIRWWLVAALVAGFLAGVGIGAEGARGIPERPLRGLFVGFLVLSAARSWRMAGGVPRSDPAPGAVGAPGQVDGRRAGGNDLWHGLWIGALGGVLSGALGIGGGIVMVPLLAAVIGLGQREAQATSLATMLPPVGLPGVLVYARGQGGLPWPLAAVVVAGFALGGYLSARRAARVSPAWLSRAFALFTAAVAVALAVRLAAGA
jgi:hypothetical protein